MVGDSIKADDQFGGDILVAFAVGDQAEHFHLAGREAAGCWLFRGLLFLSRICCWSGAKKLPYRYLARFPGGLAFDQQVVLAIQLDQLGAGDQRTNLTPLLIRNPKVANCMENQSWDRYFRHPVQHIYRGLAQIMDGYGNLLPTNGKRFPLPDDGFLPARGWQSIGTSIGGGTREIQKNIIAQRGLGLPR